IKRPPNEWLCFRSEQLALKKAAHPGGKFCMDAISTELSIRWAEMDAAAKEPYKQAARDAKALHAVLHPNYKFTP
ncbi:mating-type protein MAT1-2, partial [Trametes versicolor FP-101664 SS1]|uniref:mating-type protein MAT1-2 n=1 Tax=Trametes versicolor (strain FP-101664) TaxID=717944 RepID=UPI0004621473